MNKLVRKHYDSTNKQIQGPAPPTRSSPLTLLYLAGQFSKLLQELKTGEMPGTMQTRLTFKKIKRVSAFVLLYKFWKSFVYFDQTRGRIWSNFRYSQELNFFCKPKQNIFLHGNKLEANSFLKQVDFGNTLGPVGATQSPPYPPQKILINKTS